MDLHPQLALSVPANGKLKTAYLPASLAAGARRGVDFRRRSQEAEARICAMNLARLLRRKEDSPRF